MIPITFFIEGVPCGQPRPRFSRGHAYNPPGPIDGWRAAIAWGCKAHKPKLPLTGPVFVSLVFVFPRPKTHFLKGVLRSNAPHWHTLKPDRDNCEKAVTDTLTRAGFWLDDSQVCGGTVEKHYGNGPKYGCHITIETE